MTDDTTLTSGAQQPDGPPPASPQPDSAPPEPETRSPAASTSPRPEGVPPVLDEAHIGDIHGALGTIGMHDTRRAPRLALAGAWRCWRSWARA